MKNNSKCKNAVLKLGKCRLASEGKGGILEQSST